MNKTKDLLKKMRARKRPHARGGVQKFLRARAGAGVKSQNSCRRGRARGSNLKILAGAGGRGRPQRPPGSPRPLAGEFFPTLATRPLRDENFCVAERSG